MKKAVVSIIMGSDSDLPVMQEAAVVLEEFTLPFELTIVSAHRTPERMYRYARQAHTRGLRVIIAGAGGAAHLPGMVASLTPLPVIGVPVQTRAVNGLDSLYSIVQMPPGIPVATVAINGAKNAGLLAVKILASADRSLLQAYRAYMKRMAGQVETKARRLETTGYREYQEVKAK